MTAATSSSGDASVTRPLGWLARLARTPQRPTAAALREELNARCAAATLFAQHGNPAAWTRFPDMPARSRTRLVAWFTEWETHPERFHGSRTIADTLLLRLASLSDEELARYEPMLDGEALPMAGTRRKAKTG